LWDWCAGVGLHEDKPKNQFEQIWNYAQKSNPSPSCGEEGVNNCIRGWYWRTFIKIATDKKVVRHPSAKTVTANELLTQIENLVAQELPKKHLYIKFAEIAKGFPSKINLDGTQVKLSCDLIRDWFKELERIGKGVIRGIGNKLKFSLFNKTAESAESVPNDVRQYQNIDVPSFEELVPKCRQSEPPSNLPEEIDVGSGKNDLPSQINNPSDDTSSSTNRQIGCNEEIPKPSDVEHDSAQHSTNRQDESSKVPSNSSNTENKPGLVCLLDYLAPLPNFNVGDKCQYVGSNPIFQKQYGNQLLSVTEINYRKVTCCTESGNLTTWLNPQDLRKIQD
jgi:hypothetical protein